MRYFSNLKNDLLSLPIIQFLIPRTRVKRRQSFGPDEALPVSIPPTAPQPPSPPSASPSPGIQPLMVAQSNTTTAATPALPPPPRSIAEQAIPAALSVAIYGSIPANIQLHPRGFLYPPLIAFIALAVFTSLGTIICSLAKPDGSAGAAAELAKQRAMMMAFGFSLAAFMLRVLLLPEKSVRLAGLVVLVGTVVMAVLFFLRRKKEAIHGRVVPEPAPDYSVQNPS